MNQRNSSPFPFSLDNKRYHTLNYHLNRMYGQRIFKAVIDAGFTCPNIDGTCGVGGCSFCLDGAGNFAGDSLLSISKQLELEEMRIHQKWGGRKMIAYFQAHTNTYAACSVLRQRFLEALSFPNVVGLSIGTRADCIDEENTDLIAELSQRAYVTVELGLQTVHDKTAENFNRGYPYSVFEKAFHLLKKKRIRVCVHIINGLYGETRADMVETAAVLGRLRPDAVKIHLLHILKGTKDAQQFFSGALVPMTKDSYIDTVCRQLEVLPPECVIERITGDGPKDALLAPKWSMDKISVLAGIDKELRLRNTMQGEFFLQ